MRRLVPIGCLVCLLCAPVDVVSAIDKAKTSKPEKPTASKSEKSEPAKAEKQDAPKAEKAKTSHSWKKKGYAIKKKKTPVPPGLTVVKMTLSGDYPECLVATGGFTEANLSLATLIQRLDAAVADGDVRAVWLKIEDLDIGRGKLYELRGAVARLRKAGKPVYAELTTADARAYLLASACNRVVMAPSGMLLVPGVRMEITFYKGLLDKLGLEFDALKMGKYKGAAEPYCRKDMSAPLRESLESLIDDNYQDLVATIAADRRLKDYQVKTYVDRGLFTATDAKKAGLIDDVIYADQLQEAIQKDLKLGELRVVTNYQQKKIDVDFSGFGGMVKLMGIMMGARPSEAPSTKPRIAIVYAVGTITEGKSNSDMFGSSSLGSTTVIAALRKAADDPKVAAVVLRIDSPGGSATASDLIWRETVRMKKPFIASMSDVAGSGGYYIAMGAKKIFAAPCTLTGSIGVLGGKLVTRGLYDKLGLNTEVVSRGANSGALSSLQPFTPGERKVWIDMLDETYKQFVGKAAEGRKMPYGKLEAMAQGRVYTGRTAKKLGLVDELGTLNDAVVAAKTAAGLKADADVDLLILPEPKSFFERLFGDPSADTDMESVLPAEYRLLLRQTRLLRELLSQKVLLWMPYGVEIK